MDARQWCGCWIWGTRPALLGLRRGWIGFRSYLRLASLLAFTFVSGSWMLRTFFHVVILLACLALLSSISFAQFEHKPTQGDEVSLTARGASPGSRTRN